MAVVPVIVIVVIVVLVLVLDFVVVVVVVVCRRDRGCARTTVGPLVVVLLLQSWSWLRTGCARIMVVNKMRKNSNKVDTYLWITQVGPQLPVDGHQYSTEEGGNKPSCLY